MSDRSEHTGDRGVTELILGALAGSTLLPFVQAVAAKAGEDVYQLLRGRLSRSGRKAAEAEIRENGTITLVARDAHVVLQLPRWTTPAMAARLENVRLPVDRSGWVLVTWREARGAWVVELIPEPSDPQVVID